MGSFAFILVYVFGGVTFLPILICIIFLHAYITFPQYPDSTPSTTDPIRDPNDDGYNIKSATAISSLTEIFQRGHEADVAAGYFAVCREYVPGGINGKPPERTTPAGGVVATESPSVYQSMYRSIFDRKHPPSLDPAKGNGKAVKRARNVFFVVLRHGHLMLYDDSEQLEVRHVISLAHHDVSIYGGDEEIPEGELWIKKNAICLKRKRHVDVESKPFYMFSENCSDKEDFYFALLQNQEGDNPPRALQYDVKHIITLVQKLHSSEEQLQTRWINALVGRAFLALYKTHEVEDLVRKKITKKISRVKKPAFLSGIVLQKIDLGESAPYITNPRLKDLTVDGDCCAEADVKYSGKFRLEIAATARIDLGTRFKAREVNLVLAVVVKKLEGRGLVRFKPPPSNRVWVSFESMPDIEMAIEPIVSSRQITYNMVLRTIESRIREVIAETVVLPHWDDSPFTNTEHQEFRGGIWVRPSNSLHSLSRMSVPDETPEDGGEPEVGASISPPVSPKSRDDRIMSMPILLDATTPESVSQKASSSMHTLPVAINSGVSTAVGKRVDPPKAMRSRSFASAANPLVSLDNVNVDSIKYDTKARQRHDATSAMMAISHRSQTTSPIQTPIGSPQEPSTLWENRRDGSSSSASSKPNSIAEQNVAEATISGPSRASTSATPVNSTHRIVKSTHENEMNHMGPQKNQSLIAIGVATAAAKKWGWGVLSRNSEPKTSDRNAETARAGTPEHPIGRGRPLPPPGQPLPFPERPSTKVSQNGVPKRKAVPPPALPQRRQDETKVRAVPSPSLPSRRKQQPESSSGVGDEGVMVVEAPPDSEPSSPVDDSHEEFVGDLEITSDYQEATMSHSHERTPTVYDGGKSLSERQASRPLSSSYEEGDSPLCSWQSAQEEESRLKSIWMENNEHS